MMMTPTRKGDCFFVYRERAGHQQTLRFKIILFSHALTGNINLFGIVHHGHGGKEGPIFIYIDWRPRRMMTPELFSCPQKKSSTRIN